MKNCFLSFALLGFSLATIAQETMEIPCFKQEFATGHIRPNGGVLSGQLQEIGKDYNLGFGAFDLSAVPNGAVIESAIIQFYRQGGFTSVPTTGSATFTYLAHLPFEKKPTIEEVYSGPVLADDVDWTASTPPVFANVNAQGIEILNSQIGGSFTVGIFPPTSTPNRKTIAGYNSTLANAPAPFITITYSLGEPQKPTTDFVVNEPNPFAESEIKFTDKSGNHPTSWAWDFGDGNSSSTQNPSHTYLVQGKYSVTLTASNEQGATTVSKTDYINVKERPLKPVADFDQDTTYADLGGIINFIDSSKNSPNKWTWYFGDIDSSFAQHPNVQFTKAGIYTVTLIASSDWGADTIVKPNLIQIGSNGEKPTSNFEFTLTDLKVDFIDSSINQPNKWLWDFESEKNPTIFTSNIQNPTHTYEDPGTYKPCLTASNINGSHKICREITVNAPIAPVADFDFEILQGLTLKFNDKSENNPTVWSWSFGQGQGTSELQNPEYVFTEEGSYLVTLVAGNDVGSGSKSENVNVILLSMDEKQINTISIYPNPVSDLLNISGEFKGSVQISNSLGVLIKAISIQEKLTQINVNDLNPGPYFLSFINQGAVVKSVKIIKNN
jgi:PKD repeat protein